MGKGLGTTMREAANKDGAEDHRKHLEMLQAVITRMAQNSFAIKGWSVTLVTALLAFQQRDSDRRFALLAVVAAAFFAVLDAYYLAVERSYRDLYNRVASGQEPRPFVMEPGHRGNALSALFSVASLPHLVPVLLALAVALKGWAWFPE